MTVLTAWSVKTVRPASLGYVRYFHCRKHILVYQPNSEQVLHVIFDDFARLGGEPNELPSHFAKHTYLLVRCHRRVLIPRKDQVPIRGRSIGIVKPVAEGEILQQVWIPTDGCYVRAKNRGESLLSTPMIAYLFLSSRDEEEVDGVDEGN